MTTAFGAVLVIVSLGATSTVQAAPAAASSAMSSADAHRPWPGFGRTTLSMGVSSYLPSIDAGSTFPVYGCFFGGDTLARVGGDADVHVWDGFGSLQLTTGLELTQASGNAQPPSAATSGKCEEPTDTEVQLTLAMIRAGVTWRLDPLLDAFAIPLVPYARAGLLGTGYLFAKDGETDRSTSAQAPLGARFGYEGALGLMLALDLLDLVDPFTPGATRRARSSGTFDHTFLYVEGAWQDVTTFGQPGFDLSPRDAFLQTGLPVSWRLGLAVELL